MHEHFDRHRLYEVHEHIAHPPNLQAIIGDGSSDWTDDDFWTDFFEGLMSWFF